MADCTQIASRAFASIQTFLESHDFVSTNGSMLGWCDRRQIHGAVVNMAIQKVLVGYGAFDLSLRSWTFLRSPTEFAKLYSSSMNAQMELMQVVNDSNVVLHGQFMHSELNIKIHSLFLLSWIQIQDGYATLMQSVDRSRLDREQAALANGVDAPTELWMDVNQWYGLELAWPWILRSLVFYRQDHLPGLPRPGRPHERRVWRHVRERVGGCVQTVDGRDVPHRNAVGEQSDRTAFLTAQLRALCIKYYVVTS